MPSSVSPTPGRKKSEPKPVKNRRKGGNPIPLEARARGGRKGGAKSTRLGIPDGYRRDEVEARRAKATQEARVIVAKMVEQEIVSEDAYANQALEYAISVVKAGVDNTKDRLQAARLVLDFCKQKPAEKKEVMVSQAEQFLMAVLADVENGEA